MIRGNDVGVGVTGGAAPAVEENDIAGCVFGIVVSDAGSDPLVASNAIAGCRSTGILVDGAAGGVYEGNGVTGPGAAGIRVEGAGTFATTRAWPGGSTGRGTSGGLATSRGRPPDRAVLNPQTQALKRR